MLRKWGPLLLTVFLGLALAFIAINPPSPKGLDTPADQFSSARAMTDVRVISAAPHPTGSAENTKVRDYLETRLTALGMDVTQNESRLGKRALERLNKWSGRAKTEQAIFNVIGILPGQDRSKPALLLMAHHDTVWGSPGAADDTAGIAAILEILRAINETGPAPRDIIVLFTDGEELGLSGARNFFKDNPLSSKVGAVINFEARGGGGTANMFQTSAQNGDAAKLFARYVRNPSTSSLSTFVYSVLPNDTDLTPALEKDYTAYNIANIGGAEYYHSPKITPDALDEGSLQHMGAQGLDLARALITAGSFPAKTPDATFFDVFGLFTVIFPAFLGWVFLAVGVIFYALSYSAAAPRKYLLTGFVRMLGFLLIGGVILYALNALSGGGRGSNYYDRLAAIPKLEAAALLLCLATYFAVFGQKTLQGNARIGAALPIFILAVAGQILAPTAAYFLTLPILLCGLSSLTMSRHPDNKISLAATVFITALITGYMLSLEHLLMLGVGPNLLSVAILPAAIIALSISPLYADISKRTAAALAIAGLCLSIVIALWIRFDPVASTVPLY